MPRELVEPFVARVALASLHMAPDERSEVDVRTGTIRFPDLGLRLALGELADRCRDLAPEVWEPIIADQVTRWMTRVPLPTTFAEAAPLLRVQLTNRRPDPGCCAREIANGLVAELCVERLGGRTRITRETVAAWGQDVDELWKLGVEGLSGDGVRIDRFELADPVQLVFHHAHGEHDLVASLALRLPALGAAAEYGWLFMVPHGRSLWYAELHALQQCAAGMMIFERAVAEIRDALPLSGEIYWTDGARITAISREGAKTGFELTDVITSTVRRLIGPTT